MKVIRADHLGMCFGVRDAIALALARASSGPLTILGDLVHNQTVLDQLRQRGVQVQHRPEGVATAAVLITAHGTSQQTLATLRERSLQVVEATCPLVHHAHRTLTALVREGFHPVIVGQRDHVEVCGMTGDLEAFEVVLTEEDVARVEARAKFGVVAQTTQPLERVHRLVALLRLRHPRAEVRYMDTVCQPTKQRQRAAVELAQRSDVVVVIGGIHSNNTRELATTCAQHCARVHRVQTAADLRPEWFEHAETIGITAGTSTPDSVIDAVEAWLHENLGGDSARPEAGGDEAPRWATDPAPEAAVAV
jgi:4-hydroxy-3-methylbut-2-enyl diphosphate reductase